jgi:hypothetical protein
VPIVPLARAVRSPQLPFHLPTLSLLRWLAAVGAATPVQLAELVAGVPANTLTASDCDRVRVRVDELRREGMVEIRRSESTVPALRVTERFRYRPHPQAVNTGPAASPEGRRVLLAVARHAAASDDGWVDEDCLLPALYPHIVKPKHARYKLRAHVAAALLEEIEYGVVPLTLYEHVPVVEVVTLAAAGATAVAEWYASKGYKAPPATRSPRPDQAVHHLLVVCASLAILREHTGRQLLQLWGDEDLRSQTRVGRVAQAGVAQAALPDGRLRFIDADGTPGTVDIEIIVSDYSDAKIVAKYTELAPGTRYFGPTPRVCERVSRLGYAMPDLLT